mmetsp:Transcript_30583/g.65947  ORF Transcript_30583/g.65947 Transcript_30583/m.65947 type:complete len:243 (+) Transcript_30583:316-1044(+)
MQGWSRFRAVHPHELLDVPLFFCFGQFNIYKPVGDALVLVVNHCTVLDVLYPLLIGDSAITLEIGLFDKLLDFVALEGFSQDFLQVFNRDVTGVVHIEALEGLLEQIVVHPQAGGNHRCQELSVVDFVCVVGVQRDEHLLDASVLKGELLLHHLLELCHCDGPCPLRVHLQEGVANASSLLSGQRPGHHRHAGSAEGRGLAEGAKGIDDALVQSLGLHFLAIGDPLVRQSLFRGHASVGVDL